LQQNHTSSLERADIHLFEKESERESLGQSMEMSESSESKDGGGAGGAGE
jgi:hypothetical protein